MKKVTIIALILLAVGLILACVGFAFVKFDLSMFDTMETFTNTYYESADFVSIDIDGGSSEVVLIPSEEEECRIVCTEAERITHKIEVKDGTLHIEKKDKRRWFERVGVFTSDMTIEVYLPKTDFDKLKVDNSSGSIAVPEGFFFGEAEVDNSSGSVSFRASADRIYVDVSSGSIKLDGVSASDIYLDASSGSITAENVRVSNKFTAEASSGTVRINGGEYADLEASASSGSIRISDVDCVNVSAEASSGSVNLTNVIAEEKIKAKTSSGSVKLDGIDAPEISIRTSSGSVSGTVLTDKMFDARTSSGSVKVPASVQNSGLCVIETSSGNIRISISE